MKFKLGLIASFLQFLVVFQASALSNPANSTTLSEVADLRGSYYSWAGAYFGVHAAYNFLVAKGTSTLTGIFPELSKNSFQMRQFTGGVYTGFNMEVGQRLVIGAETDYNFSKCLSNCKGSSIFPLIVGSQGATRVRFGYAFSRVLPYIAPGFTYTRMRLENQPSEKLKMNAGWTLGAGLEYAATENVIIRAEYRYNRFRFSLAKPPSGNDTLFTLSNNIVDFGVSYKF